VRLAMVEIQKLLWSEEAVYSVDQMAISIGDIETHKTAS
jgi:hypothetical protein